MSRLSPRLTQPTLEMGSIGEGVQERMGSQQEQGGAPAPGGGTRKLSFGRISVRGSRKRIDRSDSSASWDVSLGSPRPPPPPLEPAPTAAPFAAPEAPTTKAAARAPTKAAAGSKGAASRRASLRWNKAAANCGVQKSKPVARPFFGRRTVRDSAAAVDRRSDVQAATDSGGMARRSTGEAAAAGGEPRFVPGRTGVTAGYLLPLARELLFNFEEPPESGSAEADRYHALQLLAVLEETIEAQELTTFWQHNTMLDKERSHQHHHHHPAKDKEHHGAGALKGVVRKAALVNKLGAA